MHMRTHIHAHINIQLDKQSKKLANRQKHMQRCRGTQTRMHACMPTCKDTCGLTPAPPTLYQGGTSAHCLPFCGMRPPPHASTQAHTLGACIVQKLHTHKVPHSCMQACTGMHSSMWSSLHIILIRRHIHICLHVNIYKHIHSLLKTYKHVTLDALSCVNVVLNPNHHHLHWAHQLQSSIQSGCWVARHRRPLPCVWPPVTQLTDVCVDRLLLPFLDVVSPMRDTAPHPDIINLGAVAPTFSTSRDYLVHCSDTTTSSLSDRANWNYSPTTALWTFAFGYFGFRDFLYSRRISGSSR